MADTRYEEYVYNRIPFMLYGDLYRSETEYSRAPNWHENLEVQICKSGRGRVMADGVYHDFVPGDIVIIGPDTIHITVTDYELVYSAFIFDTAFCRQAELTPWPFGSYTSIADGESAALLAEMERLYFSENVPYRTAKLQETTLRLLAGLCRLSGGAGSTGSRDRESSDIYRAVREAIRYIRAGYTEKLTLDGISKAVFADKYALSRKFRQYTGRTVFTYLNDFRCQIAAENMKAGMSVSDAALSCGFTNMSFFTRTFKKRFGRLPSEYRRSGSPESRDKTIDIPHKI